MLLPRALPTPALPGAISWAVVVLEVCLKGRASLAALCLLLLAWGNRMAEGVQGAPLVEAAPRFRASCLGLEEELQEASLPPGYRWGMQPGEHSEPRYTVSSNSL